LLLGLVGSILGYQSRELRSQVWYAEFLLEIDLKILLRKIGARLNFKIALKSLHIDPGPRAGFYIIFILPILRTLQIDILTGQCCLLNINTLLTLII
jgi:hypothetical protein